MQICENAYLIEVLILPINYEMSYFSLSLLVLFFSIRMSHEISNRFRLMSANNAASFHTASEDILSVARRRHVNCHFMYTLRPSCFLRCLSTHLIHAHLVVVTSGYNIKIIND